MKKIASFVLLSIVITVIQLFGQRASVSNHEAAENLLGKQVIMPNSPRGITVRSAFKVLLNESELPGGMAILSGCQGASRYNFKSEKLSLRDALTTLSAAEKNYSWFVNDRVINLLPADDKIHLLNVPIAKFHAKKGETIYEAINRLEQQSDFNNGANKLDLGPFMFRGGLSSSSSEPNAYNLKAPINLKNVTVRDVLNAIVKSNGRAVWIYDQWRCGERHEYTIEIVL